MLDSLVRVSRRVDWEHFVSILATLPMDGGPATQRRAGLASCRCTAGGQFLHPRMGLGRQLSARVVW
jgi:hypothetical protein